MAVSRFWREQPNRYRLMGVRCGHCGRLFFPPRQVCPDCHRASIGRMEPYQFGTLGTVVTFSVVHDGMGGFQRQVPYIMAIVELDEGVRLTAQIVDAEPGSIAIGTKVEAVFRRISEDGPAGTIQYGYKFRPVSEVGAG